MSKKKVAQIIVETLQSSGVKRCYGVVGDTLNDITDAMRHHSKIEWVHMRHEEAGGFAAGAESYITGELTACAGSCGPGSLHFINGLYESHRNGAPVVMIASQLPTSVLGTGFPQEVDYKPIFSGCSVYCEEVKNPHQAKRIFMTACQQAITKKGVAVVIIPSDISATEVEDLPILQQHQPSAPTIVPNATAVDNMAQILNAGKNIGVFTGFGSADAHAEVIELCKKLNAPMAHTSRAKDFMEGNNPFNVGMTGILGVQSGYEMVKNCDTLLILGADFAWSQFYPKNAKIIQVDLDPSKLGLRHAVELGVIGGIKETINALLPKLDQKSDASFLNHCRDLYQKAMKKLDAKAVAGKENLIHPQYLIELLDQYANDDAIMTGDTGSAMAWVNRHFQTNGKRRTLLSMKHGTMANAMPQSIGLQKAYPNRQIISVSGDGGLAMLLGDLLTIAQEQLPIKIVVLKNGTLDFVELEMKAEGKVNSYTDLKNPDFAKLADAIDIKGFTVAGSHELEQTVKDFLAFDGPALLDVPVERLELIWPPHAEFSNYEDMALYGAKAVLGGEGHTFFEMIKDNFLEK